MPGTQNAKNLIDPPTVGPWSRYESQIESFEQAWRTGPLPNIDDFLRGEGSAQKALLVELVHVDLEFRLKAGEAARVESYLGRYPQLTEDGDTVLELLETERELRQRKEGDVDLQEYAGRFPAYIEELRRRLASAATLAAGNLGRSET